MPAKKKGLRRYSKGAGKTVASAMRRKKKGTLRSGRGGKGGQSEKQEAGNRHRALRGPQERREGSEKEGRLDLI